MWCPKCKNEYRAGITVCADCGSELVEELSETGENTGETEPGYAAEYEYNEALSPDGTQPEDITAQDGSVRDNLFIDNNETFNDVFIDEAEADGQKPEPAKPAYVPKRSRYEDNRSSAWTFFLVGGVGVVLVILHIAGIIDFHLTAFSRILTNSVMGALFIIFIIVGIVSAKNAARYKKEALEEEALTAGILSSFHERYSPEEIDALCGSLEADGSYEKWNCRFSFIKDWITQSQPELIEEYVEYVTEAIYNDAFPEA